MAPRYPGPALPRPALRPVRQISEQAPHDKSPDAQTDVFRKEDLPDPCAESIR